MHHDHMHTAPGNVHLYVQQPALLKAVVRNIFVLVPHHRPARQQRIAMLAVPREGVGAVHRLVALGRQKLGLRHIRPALKILRLTPVQLAHFLQANDVGIELLDRMTQVVDLQAPRRAYALHALVDVVGGNAQDVGGGRGWAHGEANCGSNKMASALEGEKQRSAASRQGHQAHAVCSRGLSTTG